MFDRWTNFKRINIHVSLPSILHHMTETLKPFKFPSSKKHYPIKNCIV